MAENKPQTMQHLPTDFPGEPPQFIQETVSALDLFFSYISEMVCVGHCVIYGDP